MFELREELARLVGYDTWADYDAGVKMIGKGSAIPEFIERITEVAQESAERDRDVLLAPAAQSTTPTRPRSTPSTSRTTRSWSARSSTTSTPRWCARTSTSGASGRDCST